MDSFKLQECYEASLNNAKTAGNIIKEGFYKAKNVEYKTSPRDLVTETDKAVENLVIKALRDQFPTHKFIGEESVSGGAECVLTDDPTWIIDPVDGTMNFVHSLPYICISIGFYVKKEAMIGVIYNPILDLLYTARKGQGAFLNGKQIFTSAQKELSQSIVLTECGFRENSERMAVVYKNLEKLVSSSHGIRCLGSAALHICHVAEGGSDGSLSLELFPWDKAAAVLLVTEAGGCVIDNSGGQHDVMKRRVICAATPELAQQMVATLQWYDV